MLFSQIAILILLYLFFIFLQKIKRKALCGCRDAGSIAARVPEAAAQGRVL
jgi:hypothetical protein